MLSEEEQLLLTFPAMYFFRDKRKGDGQAVNIELHMEDLPPEMIETVIRVVHKWGWSESQIFTHTAHKLILVFREESLHWRTWMEPKVL